MVISMEGVDFSFSADKKRMYEEVVLQLKGLMEDVPYLVANLSNASALLNQAMDRINWVGFYLMQNGKLVLGPFQGKTACIEIKVGRGVCGTAVARDEVMLIEDVHAFPGHIACDATSRSEIVLPIHYGEEIVGVLDIDSPYVGRFNEVDRDGLLQVVQVLEKMYQRCI